MNDINKLTAIQIAIEYIAIAMIYIVWVCLLAYVDYDYVGTQFKSKKKN